MPAKADWSYGIANNSLPCMWHGAPENDVTQRVDSTQVHRAEERYNAADLDRILPERHRLERGVSAWAQPITLADAMGAFFYLQLVDLGHPTRRHVLPQENV